MSSQSIQFPVSWEEVPDSTGFLFSFAKSLACAVQSSPYASLAKEVVASSGFAFRMWARPDLCPSAFSIWEFARQKEWVENSGLLCAYTDRLWGQDTLEESRRLQAKEQILSSLEKGIPAICWDIGLPEWGLITGYDDSRKLFHTLAVTGEKGELPYERLGKGDIPILNVLTITGFRERSEEEILYGTLKMAAEHLRGEEWSENASGLAVYPVLLERLQKPFSQEEAGNLRYVLGACAPLKQYAAAFLEKYGQLFLSELYRKCFLCWQSAFETAARLPGDSSAGTQISSFLKAAQELETEAARTMQQILQQKKRK